MLSSLLNAVGLDGLKSFFSDALQTEFGRMLAVFAAAAWVHSRQVRREIRKQFGELVAVLKADIEGNKFLIASLSGRVAKIEDVLQIKQGEKK